MEIWFLSAVAGAVMAGISNFYFKQAASRGYNAELFTLWGGLVSLMISGFLALYEWESFVNYGWLIGLVFFGGVISSLTNIGKVNALRFIDATLYFPLFKLLAPSLAIFIGVIVFAETFTFGEWLGMLLGLLIPLLLINKAEHHRQNNLPAGLTLVIITGVLSAVVAAFNKYATDLGMPLLIVLVYMTAGIFIGSVANIAFRKGLYNVLSHLKTDTSIGLLISGTLRSVFITVSVIFMLYAYVRGGTLAVVQTIHSMYILIPIVLSIVFYNEHWNLQKVVAIILSVAALALLG